MPTTPCIRFCTLKWMRMHRFPPFPSELEVPLFVDTSTFDLLFPECPLDDHGQRPLVSGVARIYTKREDSDRRLLPGTMRRISRARSLVSGVELWHPAKPVLENRVVFVHCIVIIMHCLSKTIFGTPSFVF